MQRLKLLLGKLLRLILLVSLLLSVLTAVVIYDPYFREGAESANFVIALDMHDAGDGVTLGCTYYTGLGLYGLNPYRDFVYRAGFYTSLTQSGYTFKVNGQEQSFLWPWQYYQAFESCAPFMPKRQPMPGEVIL